MLAHIEQRRIIDLFDAIDALSLRPAETAAVIHRRVGLGTAWLMAGLI
jgi:hypothetical protein